MSEGILVVCENRKARHNYFIEDRFEAGLVLLGTEVKALRAGKANLQDAYAVFRGSELYVINSHIGPYAHGNQQNHEPLRNRKLLMKSQELKKLWGKIQLRGYNLIPLKLYFKKGICKVEIGLGRGKKAFDKRQSEKEREAQRSLARIKR